MMCSSSAKDLRSHRKWPMIGKLEGPGGSLRLRAEFLEGKQRLMRALRKAAMEMETRMRNQVSMI